MFRHPSRQPPRRWRRASPVLPEGVTLEMEDEIIREALRRANEIRARQLACWGYRATLRYRSKIGVSPPRRIRSASPRKSHVFSGG
jgi:hypothetical protein